MLFIDFLGSLKETCVQRSSLYIMVIWRFPKGDRYIQVWLYITIIEKSMLQKETEKQSVFKHEFLFREESRMSKKNMNGVEMRECTMKAKRTRSASKTESLDWLKRVSPN